MCRRSNVTGAAEGSGWSERGESTDTRVHFLCSGFDVETINVKGSASTPDGEMKERVRFETYLLLKRAGQCLARCAIIVG